MDFSQFKSWIRNVSDDRMDYAEEYDMTGQWWTIPNEGTDPNQDERIILHCPPSYTTNTSYFKAGHRCGIVFVSAAYRFGKPEHYEVNYTAAIFGPQFNTDDQLIFYMPQCGYGHLGFFLEKEDAQSAMKYAAEEITKEVKNACEKGIPSIYFKTSWLMGSAEQEFEDRLEKDTGGTYEFEFADEDDILDARENTEEKKDTKSFMDILQGVYRKTGVDYDSLKQAFIREVCKEVRINHCCHERDGKAFFDEALYNEEAADAYEKAVCNICSDNRSSLLVLMALLDEEETLADEWVTGCARHVIGEWMPLADIDDDVLRYVYKHLPY